MEENSGCFLEWLEEFVCQERGSRIVHYMLKDSEGRSVLAVVGTERSLRHMVYVVAEEFLEYSGPACAIQAGFKWRSRREVVDWLTSMLSKQHQSDSPKDSIRSVGSNPHHFSVADKMDLRVRNLKQSHSDIMWLGASWTCGKQLKHFPAFCRNGTTIAAQSFVFVMAKEDNRYVAYLEDMYEDKKGQKKVKVRWFHHSQEVKGVVRLRNAHPKEVYITPYTQVISVECVDGPAIVLTREHFEKCIGDFPDGLLAKLHLCFRQFRSNKIKPFDLSKLKGYFDQPLISCLESDNYLNLDSRVKMLRRGDNVVKTTKRARNSGDQESFLTNMYGREGLERKKFKRAPLPTQKWHTQVFRVDDNVELLCQDSGIRGCWFRCTVLEISRKQIRLQYSDLEDQDGCGNLKEWVPAFRLAAPDKLGMRCLGRPTIRPFPPVNIVEIDFEVGDPVDAWWSDGWWEGVITAVENAGDGNLQVYVPGESLFLNVTKKHLRVSRDWVGGIWVDVKANREILSIVSPEAKHFMGSSPEKDDEAGNIALKSKVDGNNDKEAIPAPASSAGQQEQLSSSDKDNIDNGNHVNEKSDNISRQDMCRDGYFDGNVGDQNVGMSEDEDKSGAEVKETAALSEGGSGAQDIKTAVRDEDLQLANMAM